MSRTSTQRGVALAGVHLSAGELADLELVAAESGCTVAELAARVLVSFVRGQGKALQRAAEAQRKIGARRLALLEEWWELRHKGAKRGRTEAEVTNEMLAAWNAKGDRISRATLYNWERRWQGAGLEGLMDGRRIKQPKSPTANDPFLAEVLRLYRRRLRAKLAVCYRDALETAKAKGWDTRCYKTAWRFIRAHGVKLGRAA